MAEHPAVAFLRNAHERAEQLAQAATPGPWFANPHDWGDDDFDADIGSRPADHPDRADVVGHGWEGGGVAYQRDADFIAANSPDTVLARVTAERSILEACENVLDGWYYGESKELAHDVIAGLAAGWGWTGEPAGND